MLRLIFLMLIAFGWYDAVAQEKLEVEGAIVIQNTSSDPPSLGTIRFNPSTNDFEGWNGTWQSLTQSSKVSGSGSVTDIDGNTYLTVTIGNQTWMRENLRASRYNDGITIPERALNTGWGMADPAWCWYDNDSKYDVPYGKLYNGYVVDSASNGNRNVCPTGWHVPSDTDWTTLINLLEDTVAAIKLRSTGTIDGGDGLWLSPNTGTNESGFTGVPAGGRQSTGDHFHLNQCTTYWTRTNMAGGLRTYWFCNSSSALVQSDQGQGAGFSIRCIKD